MTGVLVVLGIQEGHSNDFDWGYWRESVYTGVMYGLAQLAEVGMVRK